MKTTACQKTRPFTVIEMLAVISVVTVLFAMLFPAFNKVRQRTLRTQDLSNMRQFATACFAMTSDNRGNLPIGCRLNSYEWNSDDIGWGGIAGSEWVKLRDCYGLSYRVAGCNLVTAPEKIQPALNGWGYGGKDYATVMTKTVQLGAKTGANSQYDKSNGWYDDSLVRWRGYGNRGNGTQPYSMGQRVTRQYWNRVTQTKVSSPAYVLPTNLYGQMTSRTLLACPTYVGKINGSYSGQAYHGASDEAGFWAERGTFNTPFDINPPKAQGLAGNNMGYVDGAARWVPWADMNAIEDVGWLYFDDTVR